MIGKRTPRKSPTIAKRPTPTRTNPAAQRAESAADTLADGLPPAARASRSVRNLARWADVHTCRTAGAAFAARADDNKLLVGTPFEAEFGQSPFAIARGQRVETIGRRHSYAETIRLLREHFDFEVTADRKSVV